MTMNWISAAVAGGPSRKMMASLVLAIMALTAVAEQSDAQRTNPARLLAEITIGSGSDRNNFPAGFTMISRVNVGRTGDIYVEQPVDNVIRQFDSTGRFVRTIGNKGPGPGETLLLYGSGFIADTLWTADLRGGRFSLFSPTGAVYSSFTAQDIVVAPTQYVRAVHLLVNGKAYYFPQEVELHPATSPGPMVIGTRSGKLLLSVAHMSPGFRGSFVFNFESGGGRFADDGFLRLTYPSALVEPNRTGEWLAVADQAQCVSRSAYTVSRISVLGDTMSHIEVPCNRVPVGRRFLDSVVAANRDRAVKAFRLDPAVAEREIRAQMGASFFFATITDLHVGQDGSIWLRPTVLGGGPEEWVRVDEHAGFSDRISLPPRAQLKLVVDRTHLWATIPDQDDVPTLVRFRVLP